MSSFRRGIWGCILLSLMPVWVQAEEVLTQEQIRRAVADVYRYEFGSSRHALTVVEQMVAQTHDKPDLRDCLARELGRLLLSDATLAARDFVCRQFHSMPVGTLPPALFALLHHENTVQMACYALVSQESDEVNPALRQVLGQLKGLPLIAVLNLLGDRRDADSVEALTRYVEDSDAVVADAAIAALGKIASDRASRILGKMRAEADSPRRKAAAVAYLQAGRELASRGETDRSKKIYDQLVEEEELLHVRRGACLGRIALGGPEAVPLILDTLEGDDEHLKPAALAAVSTVPGENVSSLLARKLNLLSANNRVLLIQALTDQGDRVILPVLVQSLESESPPVQIAAIKALGLMGGVSEVPLIASRLASADKPVAVAAGAALRVTTAPGANTAMMEIAKNAALTMQVALIDVLSDRYATEVVPEMLQLARNRDMKCSRAALRALGKLASYHEMAQLLDVLVSRQDQVLQIQALRAVTAVISRNDEHRDDIARLVQGRLGNATAIAARCSLLQLLSVVPTESSLQRLRAASEDRDPSVRDVAIRTLARYPDPAAIDALLQVFQTSTASAHRAVALRGCVSLLKADKISPERATKVYKQLVARASTPAEKKLILSGLAVARYPAARGIVEDFMDDDAVKAEAALALEAIARNAPATVDFNDEATALNGKVGDAKLVDSPIAGKALSLNGTDARLELVRSQAWSVGAAAFTATLWVRPESPKQAGILCVGGYGWRHGWLIDVHPDGFVRLETSNASSKNNGSIRTPGGVLASGRWTHIAVAVSRADDDARIFINGHEKAKGKIGAADLTNRDANVVIGGIENDNRYNFHGQIDEVTICRRSLSIGQIQALVGPGRKLVATDQNRGKKLEPISPAVGIWQFTRETDRGMFTSILNIKDAKSGTYTIRDNEVDLDELAVDGNRVAFKVTLRFNDREFAMQFKGAVEGTTLKGQWTTPRGTRDAEAKRVATALFDGKTFNGWEGDREFFRIEQGAIVAGSLNRPIPHNTFLATTKEYGDFELTLKAKLTGKGDNAGIQFRSRRIPGSHEMIGYQADMGRSAEKNIWTCLYDESRRRCFLAEPDQDELAKVFCADDWNEFTIQCVGRHVQIWLNGYHAIDYTEPNRDIEQRGMIGVQIHGGAPSEAWYKDITIKEL